MCQTPPLVLAVISGDQLLVKSLIKQGHSVNAIDEKGATALHWACCKNSENICEYLVEAGCNVNARIKYGSTALQVAADHGCTGCARILIQSGADLNSTNERCDTPLHTAAYRGHLDIIQLLIHAGANPLLKNSYGLTPLEEASARSFDKCVQYLLPYNTNIYIPPKLKHSEVSKVREIDDQSSSSVQCKLRNTNSHVHNNLGNSQSSKLNGTNSSANAENKRACSGNMSLCPSGISSIDSDYSSYTSDRDRTSFVDTLDDTSDGNTSSFHSLYNRSVTVKSQTGSPVRRGPGVERHFAEMETAGEEFLDTSKAPELPPRPSWLCRPQSAQRLTLSEDVRHQMKATNNTSEKLVGLEVNQFIVQLQMKMVAMQEKLANYETSNAQLKNEIQLLTHENAQLKADNGKLQRLHCAAQSKQVNLYHQGLSELDEGVHSGSYLTNQSTDKLNVLSSVMTSSSLFNSPRSREPVESNELV